MKLRQGEEEETRVYCKYKHPLSFRVILDDRLTVEKIDSIWVGVVGLIVSGKS